MAQRKDHVCSNRNVRRPALIRQFFVRKFANSPERKGVRDRGLDIGNSTIPLPAVWDVNAATDQLHMLQLANTRQDFVPRSLEIVTLVDGHVEQSLDSLHVLRLHLTQVIEECEFSQGCHKRVPLQLKVEVAHDTDRVLESIQTQLNDLHVVCLLQRPRNASQNRYPGDFEHGSNMDEVRCAVKLVARF